MKLSDIVELAKAGYKPNDIKELLELAETVPETKKAEIPTVTAGAAAEVPNENTNVNAFEELIKSEE